MKEIWRPLRDWSKNKKATNVPTTFNAVIMTLNKDCFWIILKLLGRSAYVLLYHLNNVKREACQTVLKWLFNNEGAIRTHYGIGMRTFKNVLLTRAAFHGYVKIMYNLIEIDANIDCASFNNRAIKCASEKGHTEVVRLLLKDSRVDPSAGDNLPIRWASENGHTEVVQLLLKDPRVDPSVQYNRAIKWASVFGHIEVVRLLLKDPRVDPSVQDNYAIRWASENGHTEMVQLLLADERVIRFFTENDARLLLDNARVTNYYVKKLLREYIDKKQKRHQEGGAEPQLKRLK